MKQEYSEPEEIKKEAGKTENTENVQVPNVDPLMDDPIKVRPHTGLGASGTGSIDDPIPEWTPPPFTGEAAPEPGTQQEPKKSEFANEGVKDMPINKKMEGATQMATAILEGVSEIIKEGGNLFLPIKQGRLRRLEESGDINLDIQLQFTDATLPARDAITRFNEHATDVLFLSDDFKEQATPIIAEELAKKDIALTPVQYLMFVLCPLELKRLGKVAIGIRSTGNEIIAALKETTAAYQQHGGQAIVTPQAAATQAASQQSVPQDEVIIMQSANTVRESAGLSSAFDDIQQFRGSGQPILHPDAISNAVPPQSMAKKKPVLKSVYKRKRVYTKKKKNS